MNWNILRGLSGNFEIGRVCLVGGTVFAIVTPIIFESYEIGWNKGHFDVTAWCLAYPGGLAALNALGVFAIGNKEKQVATAQVVRDTGSQPGSAAPAPTGVPAQVQVVNAPNDPVPVKDKP